MHLDLDPTDRRVVLFGTATGSRRAVARYAVAGARITVVLTAPDPQAAPDPLVAPHPLPAPDRLAAPDPLAGGPSVRWAATPRADDRAGLLRLVGPAWLVVLVDPGEALADRVRVLCGQLKIMMVTEPAAARTGSVTLVGGGPGAPGLLTADAIAALREADVVFHDRLGPVADLARLAPTAELVDVGKSPFHHRVSQRAIEQQLVDRARAGASVVRLKGGDPFVFGRGGEEVLACTRAGIAVRVVPGVSSAVAVPAAAGIPVTHRGVSRSYTVVSGHVPLSPAELSALAGLGGTVVILMGMATLEQTVAGLIRAGMPGTTPAAVVERGFSVHERRVAATLDTLGDQVRRHGLRSPAVVVIGAVVALAAADGGTGSAALELAVDRSDRWS